jgi:DNA-3-methyladenine glycosylase II
VLNAGFDSLRALGFTRQKAGYCINVAHALETGTLSLEGLRRKDDQAAASILTRIVGIGPWTASIYLLMALKRPDVWPPGDIALIRSVRKVKKLPETSTTEEISAVADQWRPYRSVAARMLWHHYLSERDT